MPAFKPPDDLQATATDEIAGARAPRGDGDEGTSVDSVFYPELHFEYEKQVTYRPIWEVLKPSAVYDDAKFETASKQRAQLAVGHTFTELDRTTSGDKLYLKLPHPDGKGDVWLHAGALTTSHRDVSDAGTRKTFTNAKVTSNSWHPQKGYRGKVTLTYTEADSDEEQTKEYKFITIGEIWKYVSSGNRIGYRWFGPMTRAPEGTYAGYIMARNKYAQNTDKKSVDGKYSGAEASRSIWVIWHHAGGEWKQGAPRSAGGSYTVNVFVHPGSRFYHLEGCLAPCKTDTADSDDGFSSFTDSEATMDEIFELAHGAGTTCQEPAKSKEVKWYRIRITDLKPARERAPVTGGVRAVPGGSHPLGESLLY